MFIYKYIFHWIFLLLSTYNSHVPCVGVIAIAEINEALNSGDPEKTLAALLLPTAKLQGVNPANTKHYHDLLLNTKDLICKVKQNYSAEPMKCQRGYICHFRYSFLIQMIWTHFTQHLTFLVSKILYSAWLPTPDQVRSLF